MRKLSQPLIALLGLALLAAPAHAAAQITIGQMAPKPEPRCSSAGPLFFWQTEVGPGPDYMAPGEGAITSWSTNASVGPGQLYTFRVLRPLRAERFRVVGHDGPETLTEAKVNTFQTAIPVQPGDILALEAENSGAVHSACVFSTPNPADTIVGSTRVPADGDGIEIENTPPGGERVNVSATFLPPPAIATLSPASGPPEGGSAVTIAGSNFATVKSVSFDGVAAKSFTVSSESRLIATAPPGEASAEVPVVVRTAAGNATATFTYAAAVSTTAGDDSCHVPKLKAKTLKAAKKQLRKAGCRLGTVKKRRRHGARAHSVIGQSPKPGKLLPQGAKVNVAISQRPPTSR